MSHYYLVASLPVIKPGEPPPLRTEDFVRDCAGLLSDHELADLKAVLFGEAERGFDPFMERWYGAATQIGNAVARGRAGKLGIEARPYLRDAFNYSSIIDKMVVDALAHENPLEKEKALDRCRFAVVDELAGLNAFDFSKVLAFAVKLKIAERWQLLDAVKGQEEVEAIIARQTAPTEETSSETVE